MRAEKTRTSTLNSFAPPPFPLSPTTSKTHFSISPSLFPSSQINLTKSARLDSKAKPSACRGSEEEREWEMMERRICSRGTIWVEVDVEEEVVEEEEGEDWR